MFANVDTNLLGLLLIAAAFVGFILFVVGRRRPDGRGMARAGAVTVALVLAALMLVIASAALGTVGG
jgi:hypothetical protein